MKWVREKYANKDQNHKQFVAMLSGQKLTLYSYNRGSNPTEAYSFIPAQIVWKERIYLS